MLKECLLLVQSNTTISTALTSEQIDNYSKSIHVPKFYPILFYHLKKLLYQLYYIILWYS